MSGFTGEVEWEESPNLAIPVPGKLHSQTSVYALATASPSSRNHRCFLRGAGVVVSSSQEILSKSQFLRDDEYYQPWKMHQSQTEDRSTRRPWAESSTYVHSLLEASLLLWVVSERVAEYAEGHLRLH